MERNLILKRECQFNWILINNDIKSSNISRSILYQDLMEIEKSNIHEFYFARNYIIKSIFVSL